MAQGVTALGGAAAEFRFGWRRLLWPVALMAVAVIAYANRDLVRDALRWLYAGVPDRAVDTAILLLLWLFLAFLVIRVIDVAVWHGVLMRRSGAAAPQLLTDLFAALIWVLAVLAIIGFVFKESVTGIIATSGIAVAVVGFALQRMIADLFSGIALSAERPFQIGDWIETADGAIGRVVEITWRATRLETNDSITIVVPNGHLAAIQFRNFSRPEAFWRDRLSILLDYGVSAPEAERILLSACHQVPESAAVPRLPEVRVLRYTPTGVEWELRYWVPDYHQMPRIRETVHRNILHNLHVAGLAVPFPKREVFHAPLTAREAPAGQGIETLLPRVALFAGLPPDDVAAIAAKAVRRLCPAGRPVVRQGEPGSSLFILNEGALTVSVRDARGVDHVVGQLTPGAFFGEMSLMTGEPRSASVVPVVDSVVFEITKASLEPALRAHPALAATIGDVLAARQAETARRIAADGEPVAEHHRETLTAYMLHRIREYFALPGA